MSLKTNFIGATVLSITAFALIHASAAPAVFTIDQSQSQISAAGTVEGAAFSAQGPGALTTSYSGSINADVSGSTIQFTGGSAITAQNSGNWEPDETLQPTGAPANYGPTATISISIFSATVYGALRNIVLDLTSTPLTVAGGSFAGTNLVFSSASDNAVLDYYVDPGYVPSGSKALTGYATNAVATGASLSTSGSTQTLVVPIDATFYFTVQSTDDTVVHLTGQIVATRSVSGVTAPVIDALAINGSNVELTVENATGGAQVEVSTDLINWTAASSTTTTVGGKTIFTTPRDGTQAFYRIEQ